jgi:UPF0716 protein FxsA
MASGGPPTASMTLFLLLIFVVAPLVELAVIVQVAGAFGVLNTIGLMVLMSLVGAWLAKREGLGVLRRIQAALDRGDLPSREVADGGLILLAGALMIAPGFISDCLALVLLFPPTRALVRPLVLRLAARRGRVAVMSRVGGMGGSTWTAGSGSGPGGDVWDVDSWEDPPRSGPARGELEDGP